jgi:hypothetical protein
MNHYVRLEVSRRLLALNSEVMLWNENQWITMSSLLALGPQDSLQL